MRIQIINIFSEYYKQPLVEFASPYGIGRARWADSAPPLIQSYDVEFEIPETLIWGQTIVPVDNTIPAVSWKEDILILAGQMESLAEDGIGTIRIGKDILLIEIEELKDYLQPVHNFVHIFTKQALIYDIQS